MALKLLKRGMRKQKEAERSLLIGSDPEISFLREDGRLYEASRFLPTNLRAKLGCDGCSSIGELRPNPKNSPLEHTREIEKLFRRLVKKMPTQEKLSVVAGNGNSNSLGGHIHFNIPPDKPLIRLLDLMAIYLSVFENKEWAVRRRTGSYGQLGAIEPKRYGFEYRTLGSFLGSRFNTAATLSLAYLLVWEWSNAPRHISRMLKTFQKNFPDEKEVRNSFNHHRLSFFQTKQFDFFTYFEKNIKRCLLYPEYSGVIATLFGLRKLGKTAHEFDALKWWDLKEKRSPRFRFSKDAFLIEIGEKIENRMIADTEVKWKVYGLKKQRGDNLIRVTHSAAAELIRTHFPKLTIEKEKGIDHRIGFSYNLREEKKIMLKILELLRTTSLKKEVQNYDEVIPKGEEGCSECGSTDCGRCSECDNPLCACSCNETEE